MTQKTIQHSPSSFRDQGGILAHLLLENFKQLAQERARNCGWMVAMFLNDGGESLVSLQTAHKTGRLTNRHALLHRMEQEPQLAHNACFVGTDVLTTRVSQRLQVESDLDQCVDEQVPRSATVLKSSEPGTIERVKTGTKSGSCCGLQP
jgi:hypothetical protein